MLLTGADMLWITVMAQKAIIIAANWASEQELQFSSKKIQIVLFTHKWNPDLGFLSMNGSKLELSWEARLLSAVTIDGKKFSVFNYKFIASFIFVHEVIVHPVCAYRIMSIRIGGI